MYNKEFDIVRVAENDWDAIIAELNNNNASQFCVIAPGVKTFGWRNSTFNNLGFNKKTKTHIGYFPIFRLPELPTKLTHLIMVSQKINEEGAIAIANNLQYLSSLDIRQNSVGENGASHIANNLHNLSSLYISSNNIGDNGASHISNNLHNLSSLDISDNNVGNNGASHIANNLHNLSSLYISDNSVGDNGAFHISNNLHNLASLNINDNDVSDNGASHIANNLRNLSSLYISRNNVGENGTSHIANNLHNLSSLYISSNNVGENGASHIANNLHNLSSLNISHNNVGENGASLIASNLHNLSSLIISSNNIGENGASHIANRLHDLSSLYIRDNNVGDTGASHIANNLHNLSSLYISSNNIGDNGASRIATNLHNLSSLDISFNNIGDKGASLIADNLHNLLSLNIRSNNVGDNGASRIATNLHNLSSLNIRTNNIGDNGASHIANNLHNLSSLDISFNNVGDNSASHIANNLHHLSSLNIAGTGVTDLSPFISRIINGIPVTQNGPGIAVLNCELLVPPVEVVESGPDSVRNYFVEIAAQGSDYLYEAKVLILGEGAAGKTSLLRRLYFPDKQLPQVDETTRGIDIHRHDFDCGDRNFRLNVWDFGGQQIYHATHQFFLTKNSLYVLVDDTKKDNQSVQDEGFKYWLEVVETLSDSSPVIVFQNEKGGRSKQIDQSGIRARFDNVKEFCRGNLDLPNTADELRDEIKHIVQKLPHVGEAVPAKWINIRADIETLTLEKPYISLDDYFSIYSQHLDFDKDKALHLSQYLHDLGVFLHFQDDLLLQRTIILQNRWATETVFKILDDEYIKSQFGQFDQADYQRLWHGTNYAQMHPELLGLMEKFELCYPLPDKPTPTWLSPQLLSPSKPGFVNDWDEPADLTLRYHYDFLPRGLLNRLMVRMNRFVRNIDQCWAYGAFFEHENTQLLAYETASGDEIVLRSRGPEKKELLSVVASDLESVNQSFKGLTDKVNKRIPCNCNECALALEPHSFAHKDLLKRKSKGVTHIECNESYQPMSVIELLEGLKIAEPAWAQEDNSNQISSVPDGEDSVVKTIRLFLASSNELWQQRDEFELYLRQQNDGLRKSGLYLEIIRWENFLDTVSGVRKQDDYNNKIRACDLFVSLFKTKTGKYTQEEFDVAHQTFLDTGKPKIWTYFQTTNISIDLAESTDVKSLLAFKKKLGKLGHFHTSYDDIEHLKRQFRDQLDILREDNLI